jgi:hypothetical protein
LSLFMRAKLTDETIFNISMAGSSGSGRDAL